MRNPCLKGNSPSRRGLGLALVVLGVLSWSLVLTASSKAAPSVSASSNSISVQLTPTSIKADGIATTTATATVSNGSGPVIGDNVTFTANGATMTGTDQGNGTYMASITSSTTPSTPPTGVIIAASDPSGGSGQATLVQFGPSAHVSVALSKTMIAANGSSTTTVAAKFTDANGNGVPGEPVVFTTSDPGETIGPVQDLGGGIYSAVITSSTTPSTPPTGVTITATDTATSVSGKATLVQYGPATHVVVTFTNAPILADGSSTTAAVANITDVNGNGVPGENVVFSSSDPNEHVGTVQDVGNGLYIANITSSTTVGPVTITATDFSAGGIQGHATLNQIAGPTIQVSVSLSPASIPASGSASTVATATISDAQGHPLSNDAVVFVTTDPGDNVGPTTSLGNGKYSATVTSSTTPGNVQVVAVDETAGGIIGQAALDQTGALNTTVLSVVPAQPVTNQTATIVATVEPTILGPPPSGSVTVQAGGTPISGCQNLPITPGNPAATCQTSFAAADSPVALTAQFTPSGVHVGTSSGAETLTVGQDSSSTSLTASSSNPTAGSPVTYLAAVVPKHTGSAQPSGSVKFTDGSSTLHGCGSQPVLQGSSSSGAAAAVCRVTFGALGPRTITAHYSGDGSFTGSDSPSIQTVVHKPPPPQRLSSLLVWQFGFTPTYTDVQALIANGVPVGASVQVKCQGGGCPYGQRTTVVSNAKSCKNTTTRRCTKLSSIAVNLVGAFHGRRLRSGAALRVEILRSGWIGKYYLFTIRAGQAPRQHLACLAPGGVKPGVGC